MRKALNENPMVQIGALAVCAVIFAVVLFTMVLKKDDTTATTSPTASATSTGAAPTTSTPATSAPAADPAASAAPSTTAPVTPPAGGAADGRLPAKGLPEDVLVAFAKNETIALLVVDPKGVSDNQVKSFTETLNARDDVEVFTVPVDKIAKYARITAGVSVSRTPALVVIRPRKLTGSVPTASVSYGFRGPRSINQAVDDALYDGKQVPSYP
jgi:hypothetical protein